MYTELFIALLFLVTVVVAYFLGKLMHLVFSGKQNFTDFVLPLERWILKLSGIDAETEMDWKRNLYAMLRLNFIFSIWAFAVLLLQGVIPVLNPLSLPGLEATLALNTVISFVTNTNLQHYTGEAALSYFSQVFVVGYLQFVSAATGIAVFVLLLNALKSKSTNKLGNFYVYFVKSLTRILLPISSVVAVVLILNGVPNNVQAPETVYTLEGKQVLVPQGPVAGVVAIKQLGTNGGGYFGTNSAHPFENPNELTNSLELFSILVIPVALVFMVGFYLEKKRLSWVFFIVMTIFFVLFAGSAIYLEQNGNPNFFGRGIVQPIGNMEGKEMRIGAPLSAFWGIATTSTSNGSVNSMHDSHTPLTGGLYLIDMLINAVYGGVGVGFINFFMYIIIAVFISGLMVGRTPEFLGKKIESKEIKIASLVVLFQPLIVLPFTAIACFIANHNSTLGWLNNSGYHGFSEMFYEFTSSFANNGSGFEGLGDNTVFWNLTTGVVMFLARYIPIIGPIAIAASLAAKKTVPITEGSLRIDSAAFGIVLFGVIVIITGLSFLPALALGPIAEYFSM